MKLYFTEDYIISEADPDCIYRYKESMRSKLWLGTIRYHRKTCKYYAWVCDAVYSKEFTSFEDADAFIVKELNKSSYQLVPKYLEILL
jgi:hypothetical protein